MKKSLAIFLAAMLSLSMASCGNKAEEQSSGNTDTSATETADTGVATGEEQEKAVDKSGTVYGETQENASKQVDMGKVDGKKLDGAASEDSTLSEASKIGSSEVAIDDAKLIEYDGEKLAVVSFRFKNTGSNPTSFDGLITVDVTQNGTPLSSRSITGVEGINILSCLESVEGGQEITVQKIYVLADDAADINVMAYKYGEQNGEMVGKAFKIN